MTHQPCPNVAQGERYLDAPTCALLAVLGIFAQQSVACADALAQARNTTRPLWCPVSHVLEFALKKALDQGWVEPCADPAEGTDAQPHTLSEAGRKTFAELMGRPLLTCYPLNTAGLVLKMEYLDFLDPQCRASVLSDIRGHLLLERDALLRSAPGSSAPLPESYVHARELARIEFDLSWIATQQERPRDGRAA